jgi:fatty acid desaturase
MLAKPDVELNALKRFRAGHPDLFKKNDALLLLHLGIVLSALTALTYASVESTFLPLKILFAAVATFFWFSLVNVTIHHHTTHHNAAASPVLSKALDILFYLVPARKNRYVRAHLNHHARPFHETDVDHRFGLERYLAIKHSPAKRVLYFFELTFVGGFIPGPTENTYLTEVPIDQWNIDDYKAIMQRQRQNAILLAPGLWIAFFAAAQWLPWFGWGWLFPMLMLKNWSHYLGQFQHYDEALMTETDRSVWRRTRSFHVPGWFNYLTGGEISGHFVHHLFPQIPYYKVERARKALVADPELARLFVHY